MLIYRYHSKHGLTLHHYTGDDCVIASRPWTTSPPTTEGLAAGAKAMCEEFPRVWSAAKGQLHVAVNGS